MTFSSEHDDFRRTIRRYIEEKINPRVDEWEREQMMPLHEVIADMAKLGFVGLEYDPEYGGQGADHLFTLVLAEELGRVDHGSFPMAFGVHVAMATPRCTNTAAMSSSASSWLRPCAVSRSRRSR